MSLPLDAAAARRRLVALRARGWLLLALLAAVLMSVGCSQLPTRNPMAEAHLPVSELPPRELTKVALPPHRVAPPDVLQIDVMKVIPKPPYKLDTLDILEITVAGALPDQPIAGGYQVQADGTIDLGAAYGAVAVVGLTVHEAREAVQTQLAELLRDPQVTLRLAQTAGLQPISGPHLVAPDGTLNLGNYGRVFVAGQTLDEVKATLERHLSEKLLNPIVSVDMLAYNSRVYYIVSDGAGFGEGVTRIPLQGHETVLDAVSNINGLSGVANKNMWIARPAPDCVGYEQRLEVHWDEIVQGGQVATNYQLLPGDRLYIQGYRVSTFDATIARFMAPVERISGGVLLMSGAIRNLNQSYRRPNNNWGGF